MNIDQKEVEGVYIHIGSAAIAVAPPDGEKENLGVGEAIIRVETIQFCKRRGPEVEERMKFAIEMATKAACIALNGPALPSRLIWHFAEGLEKPTAYVTCRELVKGDDPKVIASDMLRVRVYEGEKKS